MPTQNGHTRSHRLTAAFLTAIQAQGIAVGVGHHQSVRELINRLPDAPADAVLGDSLVAIFATSGPEQKLYRKLYQQSLAAVNAMDAPAGKTEDDPITVENRNDLWRLLLRLGGLVLTILVIVLAYLYRPKTEFLLPDRTVGIMAGTRTPLPNLDSLTEIGRVGEYAWPGLAQPGAPTFGRLDTIGGPLTYEAPNDTVRDAFTLTLSGTERRKATIKYNIIVLPDTARTQEQIPAKIAKVKPSPPLEPDFSPIDPLPHPRSLADLAPVEAKNDGYAKFFYYAWWPLMALIGLILMTGLFLLLRFLQKRKLRLVGQREQSDGAPHFWRIELPELRAGIDWGENYPALLRQLRRRREDEHRELDLKQTITDTIRQGGLPSFHYRSATRPAEYLLLIDRGGANNHHARLFEQLYQQLTAEEVLIERYFYDGDPRLLYQQDRAQSTPLVQLQRRFPNARLLMVGSGDRLIHPATGKLAKWVEHQLGPWTSRSLLTTVAPSDWGRDERRLSTSFAVLPASMQGLRLLVERINDGNSGEAAIDYRSLIDEAEQAPVNLTGSLIGSLQQSFTTPQLQWIAACALYPTLHWDLTLFFGQTISEESSNAAPPLGLSDANTAPPLGTGGLLTSQNLLSLSRLPWFINGSIPPIAREELTGWLQKTYPALHRKLRLAMLAILEKTSPPPVGSVAHRELDFFRLQNEWLLAAPESPERARLAEDLARRIASGNDPDITVARFMEKPGEEAIVLPQRWNERLYPEGLKGLGVKPEVRRMLWGVPLLSLLLAFGWWQHPQLPAEERCAEPVYEIVSADTLLTIQICDKRDSLILAEHFWQQRIDRAENIRDLDSLNILNRTHVLRASYGSSNYQVPAITLERLLTLEAQDSFDLQHRENIGAMLWNQGLLAGGTLKMNDIACGFYVVADSLLGVNARRKVLLQVCEMVATPTDRAIEEQDEIALQNRTLEEDTAYLTDPLEEQVLITQLDTPNLEPSILEQLSVEEMTLDFGEENSDTLLVGQQGQLNILLHNSGAELFRLQAYISVIGQSNGIQFLRQESLDNKTLRGIGENKSVRLSFPVILTKDLSRQTSARLVLEIVSNSKVLLMHESDVFVINNNLNPTIIDNSFVAGSTLEAPMRSTSSVIKINTQISSAQPLQADDILVKNKKIVINRGRGVGEVQDIRLVSEAGSYTYEVGVEVELDPLVNEISIAVQQPGRPNIFSESLYVTYSELPTLHYIGIAPDYSSIKLTEGIFPSMYSKNDIQDVSSELSISHGSHEMYGKVASQLLSSVEETSTQKLRDFFALLSRRTYDPSAIDYINKEDLVIIHFSGLSGFVRSGYVFIPSDYERELVTRTLSFEEDVISSLQKLNRRVLILIDAGQDDLDNSRGSSDLKFDIDQRNLKEIAILIGGNKGSIVYEHSKWENGLFTEVILEAIRGDSGINANGESISADGITSTVPDNIITIDELYKYIVLRFPGLIKQTPGLEFEQRPVLINELPENFPIFYLSTKRD